MNEKKLMKKILVIGSGPIVIGQAAEFDYSGTQACKALKEEGYSVILANSNPATIMNDHKVADQVYMEPLTVEFLTKIIHKERPDALLPTLGGQTALNLAIELNESGILKKYHVDLLVPSLETIQRAEDRKKFKTLMEQIGEAVPHSQIVTSVKEACSFVKTIGFPLIVRPAYTLGGTGGGICYDMNELIEVVENGLNLSPVCQCLIEQSIFGYKEIEFEVIRDKHDQAIAICDMENVNPVGVHTGDSIVVAPSQTLSDREYQMLRQASLNIVRALNIEGGCNVQFALDPYQQTYYVIEVNPRVSRSSALASKATGYPIAKVTTKIAVGYTLDDIINRENGNTTAYFEPRIHDIVTKIPRFSFDTFTAGDRTLGSQMKSTGEVMAVGKTFNQSFLKALRSLDHHSSKLWTNRFEHLSTTALKQKLKTSSDEQLFVIAEAFRRCFSINDIYRQTYIDKYFLRNIRCIIHLEYRLKTEALTDSLLWQVKASGFSDKYIAWCVGTTEEEIFKHRRKQKIFPVYQSTNTDAHRLSVKAPYFYSTYIGEHESHPSNQRKIVVIGSGPIHIGQGIEFDYATVHCILAIQEMGYEAIIINNNTATVSTDASVSDKLYFEPLTLEDIMHVIQHEKPEGVIVQFGGQTAINLANRLEKYGVNILGTDLSAIDQTEDRYKFGKLLEALNLKCPRGEAVYHKDDALKVVKNLGYPVLVRPSYVIGGNQMKIIHSEDELNYYFKKISEVKKDKPLLIDQYMTGIEVDVDAISDGETTIIPGMMEHIERAGVHSGDSIAVYPPQRIKEHVKQKILAATDKIATGLQIKGLMNIQYIIENDRVYVLEVNPRASRTVPALSKMTNVRMAYLATKCILGEKLSDIGYRTGVLDEQPLISVKVPVFSFEKLRSVDTALGPEMKSTGEAIGYDRTLEKALYKGLIASGLSIPQVGAVLLTVADRDKSDILPIARRLYQLNFKLFATKGTAQFLKQAGISVTEVSKAGSKHPSVLSMIKSGRVQFVVNTMTSGQKPRSDGFYIRRIAVEYGIACLTNLDTAEAILSVIESTSFYVYPLTKKGEMIDETRANVRYI